MDPMARLGNALSQMPLDSRSENLLEEKELEEISTLERNKNKSPSHRVSPSNNNNRVSVSPSHHSQLSTQHSSSSNSRSSDSGHHHHREIIPGSNSINSHSGERSRSPPQRGKLYFYPF